MEFVQGMKILKHIVLDIVLGKAANLKKSVNPEFWFQIISPIFCSSKSKRVIFL